MTGMVVAMLACAFLLISAADGRTRTPAVAETSGTPTS